MKIKAILFDFDGVLTVDKTGSTSITNYISKECNIPLDLVKSCYYKYNRDLLIGNITHKDMWQEFCLCIGKSIDFQVLLDSFKHTLLDASMIELVKDLKQYYTIGMITDNKCDRINEILVYNNLQSYFDVVAISAEQHSGKSDGKIFNYVLDTLNVEAEECIFIDNKEKNLIIPHNMGFRTILFDDETRDSFEFRKQLDLYL